MSNTLADAHPAPFPTLVAVGDLMLGDSAVCPGFGFSSRYSEAEAEQVFYPIADRLDGTITFGNLEVCLSDVGLDSTDWRSMQMRGRPGYARVLRNAGFNCLSVANNHADQHGTEAFLETVELLEAEGISACGVAGSSGWRCRPVVREVGQGQTVGVLAYCLRPRQFGSGAPPFAQAAPDDVLADVARLRGDVGRVVVSLHWGEEFVNWPSESEVEFARAVVDAGASVVIGHHPHVVRPVERLGSGIVAYSLGNFVTDMAWQSELREGLMLRCSLGDAGPETVETLATVVDRDFVPQPDDRQAVIQEERVVGLPDHLYRSRVKKSLNAQRYRAYLYALKNLWRYPPKMFMQLALVTLRNKVAQARSMMFEGR